MQYTYVLNILRILSYTMFRLYRADIKQKQGQLRPIKAKHKNMEGGSKVQVQTK